MVFEKDVYYGNCSNYNPILKSGQLVREMMSLSRLHFVKDIVNDVHAMLHQRLEHYNPVTIALVAVSSTWILSKLWHMHSDDQGIYKRLKANFFKVVKAFPPVRNYIQSEKDKVFVNQVQMLNATDDTNLWHMALPNKGRTADEVMKLAATYEAMQGPKYKDGRVSGAAFSMENDDEEMKMYSEVLINYAWANPLWPKLFPGIRKMEAEVIRMCATLLGGDMETCGSMTTGGTMSILMACLAHRNRAMKKGILFPEMIIPSSAHAAFTKAAEVFRIIVHKIPVDKKTYKVDIRKMRRAINSNTCMLVGSAPNFPFGTVDDIESIGQLGLKYDVPVHVDACLGGFLLPFLPGTYNFDFRVPGVSSMSADTHKYGLAPKGSSVVLYKNREYLHNQYFCDADWQGGIYASSTLEGSRSGSNIALCWAALHYHGTDKYTEHAVAVQQVCKQLRTGIKQIPELRLQGEDDVCIISWSSDVIDINRYHHMMGERDWQLSGLQFPSGVHIMLTPLHTQKGVIEAFLEDSRQVVKEIVATPNKCLEGTAAFYGMSQKIPDRSIVEEFAHTYLDACYAKP